MKTLGTRFWIESGLAAASAALLVWTLLAPTWIENVFNVDPDHGSGAIERLIVAGAIAVTVASVSLAGREWRHLRTAAQV